MRRGPAAQPAPNRRLRFAAALIGGVRCASTPRQPFGSLSLWHVLPPAPLAHLEICARPSCSRCKGRAEKNWRGDESKTQHALPDDGKRAQTNKEVRSHVS